MRTLTIILLAKALTTVSGGWELANETNDGVKVFTRMKAGSDIREVQAMGTVNASPARVYKVISDLDNYKDFMPFTRESKVVGKEGKHTFFYSYIAPPIVSNRDYTLRMIDQSSADVFKVAWEPANDKGPAPRDGTVRLQVNKGFWLLEPTEDGNNTTATYYVYTDPAGDIPNWLINKANRDSVPDVFRAIRKRVVNKKYD
jgi:hypothetical protein